MRKTEKNWSYRWCRSLKLAALWQPNRKWVRSEILHGDTPSLCQHNFGACWETDENWVREETAKFKFFGPLAAKPEVGGAWNFSWWYPLAISTKVCSMRVNGWQLAPPGDGEFWNFERHHWYFFGGWCVLGWWNWGNNFVYKNKLKKITCLKN